VVIVGSALNNIKVLYEIENNSQIVYKKWLNISKEKYVLEVPVLEEYRGNFSVHLSTVINNREYRFDKLIKVPFDNKKLNIKLSNFRDVLNPGEETQLHITIKDDSEIGVAAEYLTTLYDASLDKIRPFKWDFTVYQPKFTRASWRTNGFLSTSSYNIPVLKKNLIHAQLRKYNKLNWFGFSYWGNNIISYDKAIPMAMADQTLKEGRNSENVEEDEQLNIIAPPEIIPEENVAIEEKGIPVTRQNFEETAFFFPDLRTDKDGNLSFTFTIPESLTKWKMLGLAHSKDLSIGLIEEYLQTKKNLMVFPNPPRFVRHNDKIQFPVKVINSSEEEIVGKTWLEIYDAETMEKVLWYISEEKQFSLNSQGAFFCDWELNIPENINSIYYKVYAICEGYSDGEAGIIPVLPNRIQITEAMPIAVRGNETREFEFETLFNSENIKGIKKNKLSFEFTSNPAWYALQALPYLSSDNSVCTEKVFSRFYAHSLGEHIIKQNPEIKSIFEQWSAHKTGDVFLSGLEKNRELKNIFLEESPWVLDAKNESDNKKNIALFFNSNNNRFNIDAALKQLRESQLSDGSWPWFPGMRSNRFITQQILSGFGKLNNIGVKDPGGRSLNYPLITKALNYIDKQLVKDYNRLIKQFPEKEKLLKNHLSPTIINHLYTRSFFTDINISKECSLAFQYYLNQSQEYFSEFNSYLKAQIALIHSRYGNEKLSTIIINSLREYAIHDDESGMYWKHDSPSYYWHTAPVETQATMIDLFENVAKDKEAVEAQKIWLLKNKQTNNWKGSRATTDAVYALLMNGTNWLTDRPILDITIGNQRIDMQNISDLGPEPGSSYIKRVWTADEIKPKMSKVKIQRKGQGISWGALYFNYFDDLDKVGVSDNKLKIDKKIFVEKIQSDGKLIWTDNTDNINVGDKLKIQLIVKTDRAMDYVHIQDFRAAGLEPGNQISGNRYMSGVSYYQSIKDSNMNFYISHLQKGTFVFEYEVYASQSGDFSNGISRIQCMYAPEFTAHTAGGRLIIKKEI
ncbi:alpha-2-macroglobulin family protein, partial [Bacteroidota bacterium]